MVLSCLLTRYERCDSAMHDSIIPSQGHTRGSNVKVKGQRWPTWIIEFAVMIFIVFINEVREMCFSLFWRHRVVPTQNLLHCRYSVIKVRKNCFMHYSFSRIGPSDHYTLFCGKRLVLIMISFVVNMPPLKEIVQKFVSKTYPAL